MTLIASLVLLTVVVLPLPASAWNIPGHMLSGTIAYQVLRQESPQAIEKVKALLQKHPWYANQWQARLQDVPVSERDLVLFRAVRGRVVAVGWRKGGRKARSKEPIHFKQSGQRQSLWAARNL